MPQWIVTTKKTIEEDWRVEAANAEEAINIIMGVDPGSNERVIEIEDVGYEGLEIIAEPYRV